jgi:hypothetical protein
MCYGVLRIVATRRRACIPPPSVEHLTYPPMNVEKTIAEVEWLERIYSLPDTRPLKLAEREAVNQRHDERYADNPWFRLWRRYGIPR